MSVSPETFGPTFRSSLIPDLPLLGLSDDERALISRMQAQFQPSRYWMNLTEAYYLGEQVIKNLRIAVPRELEFLRTIVGWPALAVDPYVERLFVDGFRLPNATDVDPYLADLWSANALDAELPLAVTDALSLGRGYWLLGTGEDAPRVTVESPLNMMVEYDLAGREPTAAMQEYWEGDRRHGALMVPGLTVYLAEDDAGQWEVTGRDEHGFDFVPVVRMPNQPRTNARDGRSAITPAIRSITDSACRTLLTLEVAREFYSVPQRVILGASEADFQAADGTAKSAWQTYITNVLALERDDEGQIPQVQQMTAYDPSTLTRLIDMYASQLGSLVYAPPQDLGLYTQGNPVSAESQNTAESRRNRRARMQQTQFGTELSRLMQMTARFDNNGDLPAKYRRIAVDWRDVEEVAVASASSALSQQVATGIVPPTSDVVRKRLGYTAVERAQLEQDSQRHAGQDAAERIVAAIQGQQTPPQAPQTPPQVAPQEPTGGNGNLG